MYGQQHVQQNHVQIIVINQHVMLYQDVLGIQVLHVLHLQHVQIILYHHLIHVIKLIQHVYQVQLVQMELLIHVLQDQ